jgi:hypothetical protein
MRKVILERTSAGKVMDIVHELREQGCVQGTDFDFAYQPEENDNFSFEPVKSRHTTFTFYTEKWATWFTLKYL